MELLKLDSHNSHTDLCWKIKWASAFLLNWIHKSLSKETDPRERGSQQSIHKRTLTHEGKSKGERSPHDMVIYQNNSTQLETGMIIFYKYI